MQHVAVGGTGLGKVSGIKEGALMQREEEKRSHDKRYYRPSTSRHFTCTQRPHVEKEAHK